MIFGLRKPGGGIFLVVDEWAVDVALTEWERGDWQLVERDGIYDNWRPVTPIRAYQLRARAQKARRDRQTLQGDMQP